MQDPATACKIFVVAVFVSNLLHMEPELTLVVCCVSYAGVSCRDDVVTCDVPFGGFVLFNNLTVHRRSFAH